MMNTSNTTGTLPNNVFCGKDKRLAEEEGNKIFNALILENFERYNSDSDKVRKMKMTVQLLEEFKIRSDGGQFFNWDKNGLEWVLRDDAWARDKISHALRFQMKQKKRRPVLQRTNSLPNPQLPNSKIGKRTRTRPRSESFDSCPAKIETCTSQKLTEDRKCDNSSKDDLYMSIMTDPLYVYDEMVSTGEWNRFYHSNIFCEESHQKHTDTLIDYYTCEIFTDSDEDNFEIDLDGDL
jgi:hypothetical protein